MSTPCFDEVLQISSIAELHNQIIVVVGLGRCLELYHVFISNLFEKPHFVLKQFIKAPLDFPLLNNLDSVVF